MYTVVHIEVRGLHTSLIDLYWLSFQNLNVHCGLHWGEKFAHITYRATLALLSTPQCTLWSTLRWEVCTHHLYSYIGSPFNTSMYTVVYIEVRSLHTSLIELHWLSFQHLNVHCGLHWGEKSAHITYRSTLAFLSIPQCTLWSTLRWEVCTHHL